MVQCFVQVQSLEELCQFVAKTLSEFESLEPDCFQLSRRILTRADRPCGVLFCLHGPRQLRLTAIWETDRHTVLFYGSTGRRLGRTCLHGAPQIATGLLSPAAGKTTAC